MCLSNPVEGQGHRLEEIRANKPRSKHDLPLVASFAASIVSLDDNMGRKLHPACMGHLLRKVERPAWIAAVRGCLLPVVDD